MLFFKEGQWNFFGKGIHEPLLKKVGKQNQFIALKRLLPPYRSTKPIQNDDFEKMKESRWLTSNPILWDL
jgi:hypothetical protein